MTGSKKRQFAINAASGFADQAVRIGVGLVMLRYLIWHLNETVYGFSELAQSALVFFGFLQLGMGPTLIRFCSQAIVSKDQDEIRKISSTAQAILGVLGTIGMLAIIGFIPLFLKIYKVPEELTLDVSVLLICMSLSFFLNFILIVPQGLSMGSNRYDLVNTVGIIASLLRFGLVVLTFELFHPSLIFLGISILAAQAFRFLSLFVIAMIQVGRAAFPTPRAINRETFRKLFGFSILNLINSLAAPLVIQGPILVMGVTLGPEVVTMFSPVRLVANSMQGVLGQISSPLVPLASQARAENNPQKMGRWSIIIGGFIAAVGLAVALPLCVFGNEIITLWLGEKMAPVWIAVAIMAVGIGISQTAIANYNLSLGGGCIRPIVYSQIVLGVVVSVGVLIGTMFLGWQLIGVTVCITTSRCLRNVFYLTYAYSKQFFYSIPSYLWLVYTKLSLIFIGVLGVGFVVRRLIVPDHLVWLIVDVILVLAVYAATTWYWGISGEIKSAIYKIIPGIGKS